MERRRASVPCRGARIDLLPSERCHWVDGRVMVYTLWRGCCGGGRRSSRRCKAAIVSFEAGSSPATPSREPSWPRRRPPPGLRLLPSKLPPSASRPPRKPRPNPKRLPLSARAAAVRAARPDSWPADVILRPWPFTSTTAPPVARSSKSESPCRRPWPPPPARAATRPSAPSLRLLRCALDRRTRWKGRPAALVAAAPVVVPAPTNGRPVALPVGRSGCPAGPRSRHGD